MTEEQRRLAEENTGLVAYAVSRVIHSASDAEREDFLSIGFIGLCEAALKYRPERGAFSSFAYRVITNEIRLELQRRSRKKRAPGMIVSYQKELTEQHLTLAELIADPHQDVERAAAVHQFVDGLSAWNQRLIRMIAEGYTQSDVGDCLHMTRANVGLTVKSIQKK